MQVGRNSKDLDMVQDLHLEREQGSALRSRFHQRIRDNDSHLFPSLSRSQVVLP